MKVPRVESGFSLSRSSPDGGLTYGSAFTQLSKIGVAAIGSQGPSRNESGSLRIHHHLGRELWKHVAMHPCPSVHLRPHGLDQRKDLPLLGLRGTRRRSVPRSIRAVCRPGSVGLFAGISPRERSGARHFRGHHGANLVEVSRRSAETPDSGFTQLSKNHWSHGGAPGTVFYPTE